MSLFYRGADRDVLAQPQVDDPRIPIYQKTKGPWKEKTLFISKNSITTVLQVEAKHRNIWLQVLL